MNTYTAPLKDIRFVLKELAGLEAISRLPGCEEATPEVVDAILDEAARFAGGVLAPLKRSGDLEGAHWQDKGVTPPQGFKEAYRQFADNGWSALPCQPDHGGQGLPKLVAAAVSEMWKSANHAFSLCPMLTMGAIEALELVGSPEQKATYLPKMISGEWTGTMNLTESQAGSDLAAIRTRAVPQGDGTYRLFGQKIFITWGDHDMTDNIVHLVLARTPDAPEGVKGISLFVVPKFLVNADGTLGERNDAWCVSIEEKLGIHASPTCVMAFGDNGGAVGTLVGKENEGLKYMFIMMNAARFAVGMEGLANAEGAYQKALGYARERIQSRAIEGSAGSVAIVHHPDVRRMLMTMKSQVEAMRALAYSVAGIHDLAQHHPEAAERARNQALVDLMIPVVKGWLTETGIEVASLGVQIHGGMGYIEETGAAQFLRDVRITTIYEGTTGIQANDLIGRKIAREGGSTVRALLEMMQATRIEAARQEGDGFAAIAHQLGRGIAAAEQAVDYIVGHYNSDVRVVAAGAVPFLKLMGIVCGGWSMARAALAAQARIQAGETDAFHPAKITTARFFAEHLLPQAPALTEVIIGGGASVLALEDEAL
ncbi:acyl-CoA dehydrogenase [Denitratisoma oestradiolicum]|uniref:3-methylmercaptopropionyl-CoA dehydrogenase n=1 Tax=Denitratisoma oestradiolicum TaxID=311182 RepID=A0A6S6XWL0_9PROT|nr:acyl-CoA dehydrogenase [Denitratisoma oestradiolicum]TWO79678.1 acyl-CoA dehydrogenase [Denitratisoma oestradiolicum]CAB1370399.1 3-methylmercaptopropionyl-CoA dehydrogenase [Denitratisoma oestradiolicum]